jgi:hypothetical protein
VLVVALRLQSSLLEEAKKVSSSEGVALNQFINVAVAEKLSALRTEITFASVPSARTFQEQNDSLRKPARAGLRWRAMKSGRANATSSPAFTIRHVQS